jgi:hypothetical protein
MSLSTTQESAQPENVVLGPEILRAGQDALGKAHPGARFQYFFHGSSGSKQQDLDRAISCGAAKVNLDTDAQYALTRATAGHVALTRATAGHVLDHRRGVLKVDWGLAGKPWVACKGPGHVRARARSCGTLRRDHQLTFGGGPKFVIRFKPL